MWCCRSLGKTTIRAQPFTCPFTLGSHLYGVGAPQKYGKGMIVIIGLLAWVRAVDEDMDLNERRHIGIEIGSTWIGDVLEVNTVITDGAVGRDVP